MNYLTIASWKKHQHYTERRPPWIKIFTSLLDASEQPEYTALSDYAKLLLHHIWLLAALTENRMPEKWLNADRLNLHTFSKKGLSELIAHGFVSWVSDASALDDKTHISVSLISDSLSFEFESIWKEIIEAQVPKPLGKKDAKRHFAASVKTPEDVAAVRRALAVYRDSEAVRKGFIQHASTWFNKWQDYLNVIPIRAAVGPDALPLVNDEDARSYYDAHEHRITIFHLDNGQRDDAKSRDEWDTAFQVEFGFSYDDWTNWVQAVKDHAVHVPLPQWKAL